MIVQAGEVTVYDAEAKPTLFKSLYNANRKRKACDDHLHQALLLWCMTSHTLHSPQ